MAKNDITLPSRVRHPRGAVKINGEAITGWLEFDTDENDYSQPDTFSVMLTMKGLPDGRKEDWWSRQEKVDVELYAGFPTDPDNYSDADLDLIFSGRTDDIGLNFTGRMISLVGRDKTSLMMDAKSSQKNVNVTASDVATKIAAKHGLTPKVTATTDKVGKYYQIDKVDLNEERTDWDLLTWLAREEGFIVFVRGDELHFKEKPDSAQDPYVVKYTPPTSSDFAKGSVSSIRCGRSLTVARGVKVIVRSWNSKRKKAFERTASRSGGGGGDVQEYRYTIANLTPEQCEARAKQILEEVSRHAMTLEISGPADTILKIDDVISLEGTGTACDQVYYPQSIRRSMSLRDGFEWDVSAKNKTPESEDQ